MSETSLSNATSSTTSEHFNRAAAALKAAPHSRIVVCDGSIDNVVGVVQAKDMNDLMKLQADFIKTQMQVLTDQAKELGRRVPSRKDRFEEARDAPAGTPLSPEDPPQG